MKHILHFQLPMSLDAISKNQNVSIETIGKFLRAIKEKLGEDYIIIASPLAPSLINREGDDFVAYNCDMKQLTKEDLLSLIGEKEK